MNSGTSGLNVDSTGQINIATTSDSASSIVLTSTNGGIGLQWSNSKGLSAEGGRAIITANENTPKL